MSPDLQQILDFIDPELPGPGGMRARAWARKVLVEQLPQEYGSDSQIVTANTTCPRPLWEPPNASAKHRKVEVCMKCGIYRAPLVPTSMEPRISISLRDTDQPLYYTLEDCDDR